MTVGERIKLRRKELKMSANALGIKLGVNRSTVCRYESGYIEKMPLDILEPIAKALQTTPQYLMGWEKEQEKNDFIAEAVIRMRSDSRFMSAVESLYKLDDEKLESIGQMLNTLFK